MKTSQKFTFNLKPVALLLLSVPWQAHADDPVATLDEVVVSGSRTATPLAETPLAIGVVNKETLERDKPKTMGEVINRIPGVFWNDLGNEQHGMGIRQPIGTNAVYQYLEDGIPIRPLGVFNHNSLNEMNLAGAEAVEVVKGPASSLYGSNAVGGAINLLTAAPSRTPYAMAGVRHENVFRLHPLRHRRQQHLGRPGAALLPLQLAARFPQLAGLQRRATRIPSPCAATTC